MNKSSLDIKDIPAHEKGNIAIEIDRGHYGKVLYKDFKLYKKKQSDTHYLFVFYDEEDRFYFVFKTRK